MPASVQPRTARLLIACPDARGLVAAVSNFIAEHGGNLLESDQHTDAEHGEFFMRAEFDLSDCDLSRENFHEAWIPIAQRHRMQWSIAWSDGVPSAAIMVSRHSHCLHDLLWRWEAGELPMRVKAIISNHPDLEPMAAHAGVPFYFFPIDDKAAQENKVRSLLDELQVDLVILARYMQILSESFVKKYENKMINIHHSFLPAFAGGDPYRQAYDRGVKLIGATSHYVTSELDAGPIIAQQVAHVNHRFSVGDLKRTGRNLERMVLAHAVRLHLQDKVLVSKNKTVVFE